MENDGLCKFSLVLGITKEVFASDLFFKEVQIIF